METKIWVPVVYLGSHPSKQEQGSEGMGIGKEKAPFKVVAAVSRVGLVLLRPPEKLLMPPQTDPKGRSWWKRQFYGVELPHAPGCVKQAPGSRM